MRLKISLFVIVMASIWGACKKSNYTETPEELDNRADVYAAASVLTLETVINELDFFRNQSQQNVSAGILSCASVSNYAVPGGNQVEITFTPGTTCSDNITRSGKLVLTYLTAEGSVSVNPQNYKIGNIEVSGNYNFQTVTEQQKSLTTLNVNNGKLSISNGDYIHFDISRKIYMKEGKATQTLSDDVFEITESEYDIELKDREVFTIVQASNETPLLVKYSCAEKFRPRGGKVNFMRVNGNEKVLLFGNGNCSDNPVIQSPQ